MSSSGAVDVKGDVTAWANAWAKRQIDYDYVGDLSNVQHHRRYPVSMRPFEKKQPPKDSTQQLFIHPLPIQF